MSDNSWPGVRLKDSPASESFMRSDISRSAHVTSHSTGSIKQDRQKYIAITSGHVHSVQMLQWY